MTNVNELREMLHYPENYRINPDVVIQKARRRQRLRATAAAGVSLLAVGLTAWSVWPLVAADRAVSPPAAETSVVPAPPTELNPHPTLTSTARPPAPPIGTIGTVPVDLGDGWSVWTQGSDVCVSSPHSSGTDQPTVGCRSTIDGNLASVNPQPSSDETGAFFQGLIPYDAARLVLTFPNGVGRDARLFRLDGIPGWMFYALHVSRSELPNYVAEPTPPPPTVTAYDSSGQVLSTFAPPPQ
jgi:hypothetical protein